MTFHKPNTRAPRPGSGAYGAFLVALAVASAPSGPAGAQWLYGDVRPAMTQEDVTRLNAAVARLNGDRSIGTVERWRSLGSKNAGEVTVVRRFKTNGAPCHTIRYVVRFHSNPNAVSAYTHTWCRVAAGSWKIVELPAPR